MLVTVCILTVKGCKQICHGMAAEQDWCSSRLLACAGGLFAQTQRFAAHLLGALHHLAAAHMVCHKSATAQMVHDEVVAHWRARPNWCAC